MIDYQILMTTFGMVFLAELGDKTQLATFCMAADCDPKLSVFLGAAIALVLSTLIAVIFGSVLSKYLPEHYIKVAAGFFFLAVGVWMLFSAGKAIAA
jgi:putative Ca2+/H+ antiporter (TMEM165/GDT1 family)